MRHGAHARRLNARRATAFEPFKRLQQGIDLDGVNMSVQTLSNQFNPDTLHPTHLRNASCDMLLTCGDLQVAILVQVEHKDLLTLYNDQKYVRHYTYFAYRSLLAKESFDLKFETLLIFFSRGTGSACPPLASTPHLLEPRHWR